MLHANTINSVDAMPAEINSRSNDYDRRNDTMYLRPFWNSGIGRHISGLSTDLWAICITGILYFTDDRL